MAGSSDGTKEVVSGETGRSLEPPTSTPVDPVASPVNCRNKIRTPGSVGGSGGEAIDFQLFTPNNKEKCIIYSEKHDCAIPDHILTDRWGTEYYIKGCPKKQLIFWYNRVASGAFDHSKSFPIFVPDAASEEPVLKDEGGGSVTTLPDGSVGNSGRSSQYKILTGVQTPRVDYDVHSDKLRLAYAAAPTAVYSTQGESKPIFSKRLATAGEDESQPMAFTTMYVFGSPTLIMQKTLCEIEPSTTPPAAEEEDLAKGVVCDTILPDGESNSTKVYNGDLTEIADFDDLTIVTEFIGSEGGAPGSVPSTISEIESERREQGSVPVAFNTPSGGGGNATTGVGAIRWMLWLNQNAVFTEPADAARGGMLYQAAIISSAPQKQKNLNSPSTGMNPKDGTAVDPACEGAA